MNEIDRKTSLPRCPLCGKATEPAFKPFCSKRCADIDLNRWLSGERSALLMQSSGLGNCVNMLSLARTCRFPLLMLITMRGEWEEFNPWQVPMGSIVDPVLKLCEAEVYRVRNADEVEGAAERAVQHVFGDERIAAVLLSQQLIGKKVWTK